jgi:hypothetical protein
MIFCCAGFGAKTRASSCISQRAVAFHSGSNAKKPDCLILPIKIIIFINLINNHLKLQQNSVAESPQHAHYLQLLRPNTITVVSILLLNVFYKH